jgi:hypothetical protein
MGCLLAHTDGYNSSCTHPSPAPARWCGKCVTNPADKYPEADSGVTTHAVQGGSAEEASRSQVAALAPSGARSVHASLSKGAELRAIAGTTSVL